MLGYVTWTASPVLFSLGPLSVRWYGLAFAIGFIIGYKIVERMFRHEGAPERWLGILLAYLVVGTIVGARLGHCLFYEPGYYLANPVKILYVWEGGLASHGGTIALILAMFLFSWCVAKKPASWTFDKVVIPIALVGCLIRLGNLMNHEIYGHPTDAPWGFRFIDNVSSWMAGYPPVFTAPSHPTQIYEASCYLALFVLLMLLYWKWNMEERPWLITGVFFIWVFSARFLIEYIKNVQEPWEHDMIAQYGINMGQLLSIPFILLGILLVVVAIVRPRQNWEFPNRFPEDKRAKKKKSLKKV